MLIVDDNFVEEEVVAKIEQTILGWSDKPQGWVFLPASNQEAIDGNAAVDENVFEHPMFVSVPDKYNPLRGDIIRLAEAFFRKHNVLYSEILRIKVNVVPMAPLSSVGKYQMPHIDTNQDHKVFLYYVNDADGDTILFNEKRDLDSPPPTTFTIDQKVEPKRGRAIVFDGTTYHAPSAPVTSAFRCVINVDFR